MPPKKDNDPLANSSRLRAAVSRALNSPSAMRRAKAVTLSSRTRRRQAIQAASGKATASAIRPAHSAAPPSRERLSAAVSLVPPAESRRLKRNSIATA